MFQIARLARALRGPQDLAPPEAGLSQAKSSLPSYSRTSSSSDPVRTVVATKSTPAKAAEDRAALFGEAPPVQTALSSTAAPSSAAARDTRPAERAQPMASSGASRKPPASAVDERAALFGGSSDKAEERSAVDRSALFGAADSRPAEPAMNPSPVRERSPVAPSASACEPEVEEMPASESPAPQDEDSEEDLR